MSDMGDATGLLGTAVGLGATLLFTGMLINQTQHMTDKLITDGKKQGRKLNKKRPQKRMKVKPKSSIKKQTKKRYVRY